MPTWTEPELALLRARYANDTTEQLARELGREPDVVQKVAQRLGLRKSAGFMARVRSFKPGVGAATRFKGGERALAVGSIRLSPQGTWQVKVAEQGCRDGERWRALHEVIWTAAHGPVPAGHVVVFRRGAKTTNPAAITIDDVECISRRQLMLRNSRHRYPLDLVRLMALRACLVRKLRKRTEELK